MIEIEGITKVYGDYNAVDNVSLQVERGELAAIVGTSGSGKTTLMRMINRLVEPTSGTIRIDGRDNRELPDYELRRGIGYAIQGHGLFPHRTVAENIATVPKLLGWDRKRRNARVDELLERLDELAVEAAAQAFLGLERQIRERCAKEVNMCRARDACCAVTRTYALGLPWDITLGGLVEPRRPAQAAGKPPTAATRRGPARSGPHSQHSG